MIKYSNDPTIGKLYARLADLSALSERGEVAATPFLTPREAIYAKSYLDVRMREGSAYLYGGYPCAERVRAILLPSYIEGMLSPKDDVSPAVALSDVGFSELSQEVSDLVALLSVRGSGFRNLTHRDYLGSVLGLGLERDVLGDILVEDEHHAYLFCKGEIADFVTEHLTHVGHDPVCVQKLSPDTPLQIKKNTLPIHDTVASPRLDCVVAALCNLSRERAQAVIRSGVVEVSYEVCDACDETVLPPCVLSVRGVGKFCVLSFDGETRKGRIRLVAEKYI